jgi:hypothetical protein
MPCPCMLQHRERAYEWAIKRPSMCYFLPAHFPDVIAGQTEGLKVGCGGMGLRWLSRFKLIRLRRISLATLAAFGGAHNQ